MKRTLSSQKREAVEATYEGDALPSEAARCGEGSSLSESAADDRELRPWSSPPAAAE